MELSFTGLTLNEDAMITACSESELDDISSQSGEHAKLGTFVGFDGSLNDRAS